MIQLFDPVVVRAGDDDPLFQNVKGTVVDRVLDVEEYTGEPAYRVQVGNKAYIFVESELSPRVNALVTARRLAPTNAYARTLLRARDLRQQTRFAGWSSAPRLVASAMAQVHRCR